MSSDEIQQQMIARRVNIEWQRVRAAKVRDVILIGLLGEELMFGKIGLSKAGEKPTKFRRIQCIVVQLDQIDSTMLSVGSFEQNEITKADMNTFTRQANEGIVTELPLNSQSPCR